MTLVWCACGSPPSAAAVTKRLSGEFTVNGRYQLTSKPSSAPKSVSVKKALAITGSFSQLVTTDEDDSGELNFNGVAGSPATVTGTVTENGTEDLEDPDSSTLTKLVSSYSYTGPLSQRMTRSVRRSALGVGDEISFALEGELTGSSTCMVTTRDGSMNGENAQCPSPLYSTVDAATPTSATLSDSWLVLPALGSRPSTAIDQQTYDAIVQGPSHWHLGLTTATPRAAWHYAGKRLLADPIDSDAETLDFDETVELSWRLESVNGL